MSKIIWDKTGERLYETGCDHGVLYPMQTGGVYNKGVAWNGLTAVTESPSGAEASPIYADNIKYVNLVSNEEFGATVEAYMYPDEFAECDGSVEIMHDGCSRHCRTTARTADADSSGWSATRKAMPSHCASACVPRRTVRLSPSPGRSLRTGSKPNSRARAATAGYCVTTTTRSNTPAGTASNARRMSGLPSSSASSLFAPKRTAFPAAMMTQPSMVIPPVCIDRGRPPPEFVPAPLRMEQAPSLSLRALRARKPCRLALPLGELAAQPPERENQPFP